MQRALLFVVAVAMAVQGAARAQDKPNFSGTWTLDAARSDAPPDSRGGRGGRGGRGLAALGVAPTEPVTITQSETEIAIGPRIYKLDGPASPVGRRGAAEVKARWDATKLVIETTRSRGGNTITTKEVRSLEAGGNEMTVAITIGGPRGERKIKQVFTKTG